MVKNLLEVGRQELEYSRRALAFMIAQWRDQPSSSVVVNGSPKTGTMWVIRLLASIPGYRPVGNFAGQLALYRSLEPGQVVHDHQACSMKLSKVLLTVGAKVVVPFRDLRDQSVSRLFHILRDPEHPWHDQIISLNRSEALLAVIEGRAPTNGGPLLPGAPLMYKTTASWRQSVVPAKLIRYEDLLLQPEKTLQEILDFLEIAADPPFISSIVARNRFERLAMGRRFWVVRRRGEEDSSSHFRKGIQGDWKNHFKPVHVRRFKKLLGNELIDLGYEQDFAW